jgi:hypothetical protein
MHHQTHSVHPDEAGDKFYAESGCWIRASNTDCLIWDSFPKTNETVTWTGDVVEGRAHGKGILQWFTNGVPTSSYAGEMKNGLADGHGVTKSVNEEFESDWVKGKSIDYAFTNATIRYLSGSWYKGEIRNGYKSGQGEECMKGGIRYIGQFKNDRFDGQGVMLWPNGDKLTGKWRSSKLVGVGTYMRQDGASFSVRQTDNGIEGI